MFIALDLHQSGQAPAEIGLARDGLIAAIEDLTSRERTKSGSVLSGFRYVRDGTALEFEVTAPPRARYASTQRGVDPAYN
jgi:hypothetical protein